MKMPGDVLLPDVREEAVRAVEGVCAHRRMQGILKYI